MRLRLLVPLLVLVFFSSCTVTRQVVYFQDVRNDNDTVQELPIVHEAPIRLQPDDKISILVSSQEPMLNAMFNLPRIQPALRASAGNAVSSADEVSAYTVDADGNIDFPVLGSLHVAGLQRSEVASFIKQKLESQNLLKDPVVTVEYVNLGVSVLGEVSRPGWFRIDRDHLSVLDALSFAGDLTIQGRRNNVTVIRKEGDVQKFYPIDLTSAKSLYSSPAYYLRQNDMVYVQPNPMRARQSTAAGNTFLQPTFWMSFASLVTSIVTIFLIK